MTEPDAKIGEPTAAFDTGTADWDLLSRQIDTLSAAWEGTEKPPELWRFLPAGPPVLRHLVLVELIKVDLEIRWLQRKLPKTIEEYVHEFPELAGEGALPCDLIYEEYQIRKRLPDAPRPQQYAERFPKHADQLRRLMKFAQADLTTSLVVAERTPTVEAGQQIDDFDLLTKLGAGAFASVFLARQRSMQRLVALKVSRDRGSEPQTLAQLDHPHIVRVFDQRTLPERQLRLMYMQHIPGGTLQPVVARVRDTPPAERTGKILVEAVDRTLIDRGDSPPVDSAMRRRLAHLPWPAAVCWLGARLAGALQYAHDRGVLHRDVKPANVLLDAECQPKLADFNVSFSAQLDGSTPTAYFGGSLAYMSPEQLEASDPDHPREAESLDGRSDVYSLAVMLWELLVGGRPFPESAARTWSETLKLLTAQRRQGIDAAMRAKLPRALPSGLEELLVSCLAGEPADRPRTAGEFARRLQLCLHPRAQRLLHPAPRSLAGWLRAWPILAIIGAGAAPSVVLSVFNIAYNLKEIVEKVGPAAVTLFNGAQIQTVNGLSYTLGIGACVWLAWPLIRAMRDLSAGRPLDVVCLPALRRRCLWFADAVTWISIALWIVAGFVFPTWFYFALGPEAAHYEIFIPSMTLCGLIAATQTFFLVGLVMVHGYYPALLAADGGGEADVEAMQRLLRRMWVVFVAALATPLIGFLTVALHPAASQGTHFQYTVIVLAAIGLFGLGFAYLLLRRIQADLVALATALASSPEAGGSDVSDSFWTASR